MSPVVHAGGTPGQRGVPLLLCPCLYVPVPLARAGGWAFCGLSSTEQQSQVREELACGCKWSFASTANVELQNKCSESCASPKH